MVRVVGLASLCLTATLFSGCGSDRREAPIQNVVTALNLSVENIKAINERLKDAEKLKKDLDAVGEAGKKEAKENFDKKINEVKSSMDDLKVQATKLLEEMRRAEKNPPATTPEEKAELAGKHKNRVMQSLKELSTERLALAGTWKSAKDVFEPKTYTDLEQQFKEAEGEFEILARLK